MDMKVSGKTIKPEKAVPLGTVIDKLAAVRAERALLAAQDSKLEITQKEIEATLIARMGDEGMDKGSGKKATVSINKSLVASFADWDSAVAYIKRTGNFQLFERRVSVTAFREIYDREYQKHAKKKGFDAAKFDDSNLVPGFTPFHKTSLRFTALKEKVA